VDDGHASSRRPRKADDLEVNEVVDGYVVYQPALDRVHYLNRTAVIVLELCTGDNDAAAIAAFVQDAFDLPEQPTVEVGACLGQLQHEQLVG
jgi:hypothetical protein